MSTSTPPRTAPCCTPRCGCRATPSLTVDGQDVVADVHEVLDKMGAFTDRLRSGEWKGATGESHQDRRQHRYRRIRPRSGDGVRGAAALRRRRHLGAVRLQRRPCRPGRQTRRTRPCHNAFHRRIQDVLDAGDADERDRGTALAHRCAGRCRGVQALRRGVDQQATGRRVRHQHRQHVRVLGLGRRSVLGRLGDRPVGDGGDRPGGVRGLPVRVPPDRRALPDRAVGRECAGAARADRPVVRQLLRRAVTCGAAVLQ